MIEYKYAGARSDGKGGLLYVYRKVEDLTEIAFKKPFKRPWHRVGDVLELKNPEPGKWSCAGKVLRHEDSAEDEIAHESAKAANRAEMLEKKLAKNSDLDEALAPLRRAWQKLSPVERNAFSTWLVTRVSRWGSDR